MKFYTINPTSEPISSRYEKFTKKYNLDITHVETEELVQLSKKNILFLGDSISMLFKNMVNLESNKYYTYHFPKYFTKHLNLDIQAIPDPYCDREELHNQEKVYRPRDWSKKRNRFIFAGALTGNNSPSFNKRYNFGKITNKTPMVVSNVVPNKGLQMKFASDLNLAQKKISQKEIYSYRYVVNIDGNGARWCTIRDIYSNSLMVRMDSCYTTFYDDLLIAYKNFIPLNSTFDLKYLHLIRDAYCDNSKKANDIIKNANETAELVLDKVENWGPE